MKNIIVVLLTIVFVSGLGVSHSFGQTDSKEQKKQDKAEKKRIKEEAEMADWNESKALAASKRFVFSANEAFTNDGSFGLDPKINFLSIIEEKGVFQFALDGVIIGGNGVGGITVEGDIDTYKVSADNTKKPVRVDLSLRPTSLGTSGIWNVSIIFYSEGYGEVTLTTNGIRLKGNIVKPEQARNYQGTSY